MKYKYQVIFTFDSEYEGYVAVVPVLPGCVSQGKTINEAIDNIKDAIKGYLYVQTKYGQFGDTENLETFVDEVVI